MALLKLRFRDLLRFPRSDGRDETAVQTATEQNTIRNLRHQTLTNGSFECFPQELVVDGRRGWGDVVLIPVPPGGLEISGGAVIRAVIDVAGREGDDLVALSDETLELRGEVDRAGVLGVATLIQGGDSDGVSSGDETRRRDGFVEEGEGEHAVKHAAELLTVFLVLECDVRYTGASVGRV